ncbi:YihY/virulence factor BrkB family protein [Noviherbaspirillum galbum]|uniref:YihY/virulence factor BrkB family protein n=1 Tax=Noviherbaspirillum galbum TaxID=2709383 RepID=A0A6B3SPA1_9BURK|nr:YihY/virulence factor BrkB family protein [Noviherbaspirillum galbum]NEX62577.1 YihY/virulence factor BrkB family protein [Noviherbaspirillum galbum]
MNLPGLRGLSLKRLLLETVMQFMRHDMPSYCAAVTYFMLFSSLPFLIFVLALFGYLHVTPLFDWARQRTGAYFLPDTMEQINHLLDLLQQRRIGMLSAGAAASLWASSSSMRAMMRALNAVYEVREGRPIWKRYLLSVLYTLVIGMMMVLVLGLVVVSPGAIEALVHSLGMDWSISFIWAWWLRWPAAIAMLAVVIALLYGMIPDVQQRLRFVTPGAVLAVIAWLGASSAFNCYVRDVAGYDRVYGTVGTLIVIPLYTYLSSAVFLLGAEMNAVIEHHAPSGKDPGEKRID